MSAQAVEQITDAEIVDEPASDAQSASAELARRERRSEAIVPLPIEATRAAMVAYQETLDALLDASDWQGPPKAPGSFVKKSGWRKVAMRFDLDLVRVDDGVERNMEGQPIRAWSVWRAVAPSGRSVESDGYCSIEEKRFGSAKGREKLENDLRATATTRAKNRAVSDLVGMGAVSAEEVSAADETQESPVGPIADVEDVQQARRALMFLLGLDSENAPRIEEVLRLVVKLGEGVTPKIALKGIALAAAAVKKLHEDKEGGEAAARSSGDDNKAADEAAKAVKGVSTEEIPF